MVNRAEEIQEALVAAFSPQLIEVVDESDQHIGHAGYQPGGQSHFRVHIVAEGFVGKSRIARHRAVHAALGPALIAQIHALALQIETP